MSIKSNKIFKKQAGVMNAVHTGLDVVGMIPGFGIVGDLVNAGLYTVRGQAGNAAISMAAAIPVVGHAATAGKWTAKAAKAGKVFAHGGGSTAKVIGGGKNTIGKVLKDSAGNPLVRESLKNTRFMPKSMQSTWNVLRAPVQNLRGATGSLVSKVPGGKAWLKRSDGWAKSIQPEDWLKHRQTTINPFKAFKGSKGYARSVFNPKNYKQKGFIQGKILRGAGDVGKGFRSDRLIIDPILSKILPEEKALTTPNTLKSERYLNIVNSLYDRY